MKPLIMDLILLSISNPWKKIKKNKNIIIQIFQKNPSISPLNSKSFKNPSKNYMKVEPSILYYFRFQILKKTNNYKNMV